MTPHIVLLSGGLDSTVAAAMARAHGILLVAAGDNVIRVLPPLTIEEHHIGEAVERISAAAHAWRTAKAA